jgi:replicative DNA helicase
LREHKLCGKRSGEKRVPEAIFRQTREGVRAFLHALFSTDGSVYVRGHDSACGVSYSTTSEGLARDVQHLLLRFGFVARLRRKVSTYKGAPYVSFELVLGGTPEVRRFLREIGLHGRHDAKATIAALPTPTGPSTHMDTVPMSRSLWEQCIAANRALRPAGSFRSGTGVCDGLSRGRPDTPLARDTVERLARALPNMPRLDALANGDVWWDEVVSITPAGEEDVFDLSVPPHANFVANDLIVHNSTITMQLASQLRLSGAAVRRKSWVKKRITGF